MAVDTLLLELGAEELPPTALDALSDAFAAGIEKGLQEAEIPFQAVTAYATPRRLAVQVTGLADKQPDREVERRGPALAAAFKDGAPTKAAEGFARSCGVSVDDLIHLETDKGTWLGYREQQQGDSVQALLPEMIRKTLQSLPVPKNMRWGASRWRSNVRVGFVRRNCRTCSTRMSGGSQSPIRRTRPTVSPPSNRWNGSASGISFSLSSYSPRKPALSFQSQ